MVFAFNPDDEPPRLIRFIDEWPFKTQDIVALYDPEHNLLHVHKGLYDGLSDAAQHMLLRTHAEVTSLAAIGPDHTNISLDWWPHGA